METFSHLNSADVNNGVKWVVLLHFHHIKDSGSHGISRCWENCFYVMREISCVAPFQRVTHSKSFSFLILIFLSNVAYQFNPKKCILLCLIKTFWHPIISPGSILVDTSDWQYRVQNSFLVSFIFLHFQLVSYFFIHLLLCYKPAKGWSIREIKYSSQR